MPDSNSIDTKTLLFVLGLIAILFGYMLIEKSKKIGSLMAVWLASKA